MDHQVINAAINQLSTYLNQSLRTTFRLDEDIVVVSSTVEQDGSVPMEVSNKVAVSLINVEREAFAQAGGNGPPGSNFNRRPIFNDPVYLNLFVMFSACFSGNNYAESLKFLSNTVRCFQRRPVFDHANTPEMDDRIQKLVLDIENLSIQDLSNLWGILGGKYLPSVLYKVRMVAIDPGDISDQSVTISHPPEAALST